MKIYKVGGCVRDQLMGIEPRDIDWLVVGATPAELEAQGYQRVGADFPVFLHPKTKDEYALARKERKTSAGHKGFETVFDTSVTLEEDLSRRDLTINAMAIDSATGEIFDPYGGRADLAAKTLRHVSEAFSEDPLRVMRLARFQARTGFSTAPETMALCKEICGSGALLELSPERICQELRKMFESSNCAQGMLTLAECGALAAIDPAWPARMGLGQASALAMAAGADAPEWAKARLACCQGLGADAAAKLMERLRFPSEVSKACARLGGFHAWAMSIEPDAPDAARAAAELERCGAARLDDADRASFALAAKAEMRAAGAGPGREGRALAGLEAAKAIATADLSAALAGPKAAIPEAVKLAKRQAFEEAWLGAPAAPAARPKAGP